MSKASSALQVFDYGIIFVNVSFYLASFALVYRIRTNPVFIIPGFLMLGISVWFSSEIANVYSMFANVDAITPAANLFPKTNLFYNNLALITAVFGFGILIMLYGKTRSGREVAV